MTGLEDDDNYFEAVRTRAGLSTREQSERLVAEVSLYVARAMPRESAREFLNSLPRLVDERVFPALDFESDQNASIEELETQIGQNWNVDLEQAARYIASVGLTTSERLGHEKTQALRSVLPPRLRSFTLDKEARAA